MLLMQEGFHLVVKLLLQTIQTNLPDIAFFVIVTITQLIFFMKSMGILMVTSHSLVQIIWCRQRLMIILLVQVWMHLHVPLLAFLRNNMLNLYLCYNKQAWLPLHLPVLALLQILLLFLLLWPLAFLLMKFHLQVYHLSLLLLPGLLIQEPMSILVVLCHILVPFIELNLSKLLYPMVLHSLFLLLVLSHSLHNSIFIMFCIHLIST